MSGHHTKADQEQTNAMASALWLRFNDSEKLGVRFGLFPAKAMEEAELQGFNGHQLVCALMDVASRNGGMVG